ncbi:hypothetical protein Pse7367_3014 [Thalassoporum mexicanum PCC 7367]|uniref:hypothetical protein n=1 Tax=Thalassoporum mexicanum TaxID=3457544 RepID=UPI00029FB9B2|nr:hypothetical protein [Pseudanabaena sp. PCC 7367]AFY71264.1 hypothetical protein Pse7367_3014 [Pseudanabaena sp. PCC 7367]
MINVYIGYDPREAIAFHVLAHSIHCRASQPVQIVPLMLSQLGGIMTRDRHPLQSTDFSFSRFLTPYLSGYQGWSIFMDCDMLMLDDVANLWALCDDRYAVMVVKHDYTPQESTKFLGQAQTKYVKKNWSSVMLFNNAKCRSLSPNYVNGATGLNLHQFKWLESEALIGDLPKRWNHLVGVYDYDPDVSLVHYTLGGPYFKEYSDCDYAERWNAELQKALFCKQRT